MTEIAVKERPILFSGEMVRAILDGRKTQTRRVIKPQPELSIRESAERAANGAPRTTKAGWTWKGEWVSGMGRDAFMQRCPYGAPGDQLWVRETFHDGDGHGHLIYRATADEAHQRSVDKWRPSIFMPRWASRIQLEVTGVRVERIQEIRWRDAMAEGIAIGNYPDSSAFGPNGLWQDRFRELWDSINARRGFGWDANPWVWVIEFRRITP